MDKKDAALGYLIGRAAEAGLKSAIKAVSAQLEDSHRSARRHNLTDDQIPEMVILNKGRELLRQGKTKEAIELIRLAVEMGECSPADAPGKHTFDCFLIWVDSAFVLNEPKDADIRDHVDDVVLSFIEEMTDAKLASVIRQRRDEYYKTHAART